MFKTISRLLFGGEEETPEHAKSGDAVEEEWFVVSHQEAASAESSGAELTETQPLNSVPHVDTVANIEPDTSVFDPEPKDQSSSAATSRAISQPKALLEMTKVTCIQKAKTWTDRHHMTRNSIQRQNRIRQGVQHHSFHLQQPGHRNLCH